MGSIRGVNTMSHSKLVNFIVILWMMLTIAGITIGYLLRHELEAALGFVAIICFAWSFLSMIVGMYVICIYEIKE